MSTKITSLDGNSLLLLFKFITLEHLRERRPKAATIDRLLQIQQRIWMLAQNDKTIPIPKIPNWRRDRILQTI